MDLILKPVFRKIISLYCRGAGKYKINFLCLKRLKEKLTSKEWGYIFQFEKTRLFFGFERAGIVRLKE